MYSIAQERAAFARIQQWNPRCMKFFILNCSAVFLCQTGANENVLFPSCKGRTITNGFIKG